MSKYLTVDHPDAHIDFPSVDEIRAQWLRLLKREPVATCPRCRGYGGWNLEINAYPLRGKEDTRENRHKHCHFRASCSQCNGWGFVDNKRDAECVHQAEETAHDNVRCLTNYRCTKCDKRWQVDSSG
jgi:hypothetical protein